jgi:hypothetical protein
VEHLTRTDDKIDAVLLARRWRELTEPAATRALRYDTASVAAHGWNIAVDRYDEWARHR